MGLFAIFQKIKGHKQRNGYRPGHSSNETTNGIQEPSRKGPSAVAWKLQTACWLDHVSMTPGNKKPNAATHCGRVVPKMQQT